MVTIRADESETTEFKTSLAEWRDVIETISAFSNKNGGTIFIGVGDKCEIIGTDIGKNTIEVLANQIKQNIDPVVYPSIHIENMDGKQVIVVDVGEYEQKPVFAFSRAFVRVGKSNQKLGSDGIRNLALNSSKVYWDSRACAGAGLEDIDEAKVEWFLDERKRTQGEMSGC
ncbi:MAG: putative DNA binding domain-containing protein [Euryarchaeota archaeon]|nr:putative DNA binding domain-containing protein [Euryarchaeota archaeon]